jgi:hypothetical protein
MPNYAVTNSTVSAGNTPAAITATYQTLLAVGPSTGNNANTFTNPSALRRGKIYDILVGTAGTPADFSYEWELTRVTLGTTPTMLGSISSVSSVGALDPADVGFASFAFNNSSAETNIVATAQLWYVGINQRASYRWVAAPGSELVWPAQASATAGNGMAMKTRSVSGGTAAATGSIYFSE